MLAQGAPRDAGAATGLLRRRATHLDAAVGRAVDARAEDDVRVWPHRRAQRVGRGRDLAEREPREGT